MIRITENDLMLFKYLLEENYIHIDDILNYDLLNFKNNSYKRERLSQLKKEGYIKYKGDPVSFKNYVFATKKALVVYEMKFEEFKANNKMRENSFMKFYNPEEYNIKTDFNFNSLIHDRKLTKLRFKLEKMGVDYWERETMFYNKYNKNPDAIFKIDNKRFAVELEKSYKDKRRYKDIFIKYHNVKNIEFHRILYITTKNEVYKQFVDLLTTTFVKELYNVDWKEKYRVSKFDNFMNEQFLTFDPVKEKTSDLTSNLEKYIELKKKTMR